MDPKKALLPFRLHAAKNGDRRAASPRRARTKGRRAAPAASARRAPSPPAERAPR
eukprot:CAMPEP_0206179272 /NCGR_PEP_ID=MMETSP1474-20131121/66997_1 /ASSEMBLY_ACC=CAM_ASM_001110 /TAXON_ID=97495 /ORGANISM="Imantonia sp., Strain RCC918" /LENGTH=54 /DNA_ID=CAMNT_0053592435 /DNA_START=57 /DNA_END=217 /DNA_ORIENTATION=-